jgi:WD40 repeat protein
MKCHNKAVATLIFPDHRLGAATEDGKLSVWDNCSGARLSSFNNDRWGPIAVSQDLTMHAWTSDKDDSIELRSLKDGTRLHEFYGHTQDVTPIAFSHKPTWLISASYDATIKIWDIADGRCLQTFSGQGRGEVSPLFDLSHDSKRLASIVGGSTVMIWDTNSGSVNLTNSLGLGMEIEAMAFSRDSLFLATGSYAGIVKIWDCQSGVSLQTLEGCGDAVSADLIAFSDDGQRLAMCDSEATAQIWDVGDNSNASNYQDLEVAYREFHWTALLLDSTQLIICYHEGTVKFWDLSSHVCTKTLRVGDGNPYRVALSQESNQLACVSLARMSPTRLEKNASVVTTWDMRRDVRLQTSSTQGDVWNLFYDTMGTQLQTEYGPISATPEPLLMDISHDGNWITYSGKNVLPIPVEYRAHRYLFPTTTRKSICGTKVAILTQAGYVWLCVYTGREKE